MHLKTQEMRGFVKAASRGRHNQSPNLQGDNSPPTGPRLAGHTVSSSTGKRLHQMSVQECQRRGNLRQCTTDSEINNDSHMATATK